MIDIPNGNLKNLYGHIKVKEVQNNSVLAKATSHNLAQPLPSGNAPSVNESSPLGLGAAPGVKPYLGTRLTNFAGTAIDFKHNFSKMNLPAPAELIKGHSGDNSKPIECHQVGTDTTEACEQQPCGTGGDNVGGQERNSNYENSSRQKRGRSPEDLNNTVKKIKEISDLLEASHPTSKSASPATLGCSPTMPLVTPHCIKPNPPRALPIYSSTSTNYSPTSLSYAPTSVWGDRDKMAAPRRGHMALQYKTLFNYHMILANKNQDAFNVINIAETQAAKTLLEANSFKEYRQKLKAACDALNDDYSKVEASLFSRADQLKSQLENIKQFRERWKPSAFVNDPDAFIDPKTGMMLPILVPNLDMAPYERPPLRPVLEYFCDIQEVETDLHSTTQPPKNASKLNLINGTKPNCAEVDSSSLKSHIGTKGVSDVKNGSQCERDGKSERSPISGLAKKGNLLTNIDGKQSDTQRESNAESEGQKARDFYSESDNIDREECDQTKKESASPVSGKRKIMCNNERPSDTQRESNVESDGKRDNDLDSESDNADEWKSESDNADEWKSESDNADEGKSESDNADEGKSERESEENDNSFQEYQGPFILIPDEN